MVVEKPAQKKGIDFYFGKRNKREQWLTAALQKRKYKGPFLPKKKEKKGVTVYHVVRALSTCKHIGIHRGSTSGPIGDTH